MNKEKDINRQRPVRPSFRNPASKALRIAGRVVNYWITKAKIETRNWHIQDALKLNDHIKKEMNWIRIYGNNTRYVIRPGDIKNFFTLCDHEQVLDSIKYLHGKVADKTQYYKVRKSGTAGVTNTIMGIFIDTKFQIITSTEVFDLIRETYSKTKTRLPYGRSYCTTRCKRASNRGTRRMGNTKPK